MKVFVLCLARDSGFTDHIKSLLQRDGHEVHVVSHERFPIADPLAAELGGGAAEHDAVIAVLVEDAGRERWVACEMATQARMFGACRFIVVGPARPTAAEPLAEFDRQDIEELLAHLSGAATAHRGQ